MSQPPYYFQRRSNVKRNFYTWLDQPVFLNEEDYRSTMTRKEALLIFYTEGLKPFIETHGYLFDGNIPMLSHIASFLFQGFVRDFVAQPFSRILDKVNIDYEYYETRGIPSEDWEAFWKTWGRMTDFYGDHQKNQYWISSFCYNRFNLDRSPATGIVDREYDYEYSDDEGFDQMNENLVRVKDKKGMY